MARLRAKPIAPEEYNTVTFATVALGAVSTTRPDLANATRPFEISFAPVRGAYVICEQKSLEALMPAPHVPFRLRIGRTTGSGWVVEREEHDIHDDPPGLMWEEDSGFAAQRPPPAKERLLLDTSEAHALYWCYGRANFERMYDAFLLQPDAARTRYQPCWIRSGHTGTSSDFLEGVHHLDVVFRRDAARYVSRDAAYEPRRAEHDPSPDVWVFDATPDPLRALYRVELMHWYQVQAVQAAAPDMAALSRARELIRAAYKGLPDVELDRSFPAQPGTPERYVLDHYRDFVWQCAANGIEWDDVSDAIRVTALSLDGTDVMHASLWYRTADEIGRRTRGRAVHPVFRRIPPARLMVASEPGDTFKQYHQAYMLGARLRSGGLDRRIDRAVLDLDLGLAAMRSGACNILDAGAAHLDFMDAVGMRMEDDAAARCELAQRYLAVAAAFGYRWWDPLVDLKTDQWAAVRARLKWITSVPQGFAKMFKAFYEESLKRYELKLKDANAVLSTLVRHTFAATGQLPEGVFESSLPTGVATARMDFEAQTLDWVEPTTARSKGTRVELLFAHKTPPATNVSPDLDAKELAWLDAMEVERPASNVASARWLADERLRSKPLEFQVEQPLDLQRLRRNGTALPDFVGKSLGSVNTALSLYGALLKLHADPSLAPYNVEAWYVLGSSTLGAIDSAATIQAALFDKAPEGAPERVLVRMQKALKGASKVVALVDSGATFANGLRMLSSDDGEIAYELRQNRRSRAELLEAKAVLQIATATAGAAMAVESLVLLGGAASAGVLTALTGPVGLMIVCGELLIAAIDARLDLTAPFDGLIAQLEAQFDAAARSLFSSDKAVRFVVTEDMERVARVV